MDSEITIQLEIPADENGYVLFQCPKCGSILRLRHQIMKMKKLKTSGVRAVE